MSARREILITNRLGLHARAAAKFVRCAAEFRADVRVWRGGQEAEGNSIMSLLMLQAETGTRLILEAEGEECREALEALARLVDGKFGEENGSDLPS